MQRSTATPGAANLDDKFFWPILEGAEALQVPIYLHPTPPRQRVIETSYAGNYPQEVAAQLATAAWGWHIETAIHVLRLILSGAFDRYPNLQLVIGHLGETLPFMLPRLNNILSREVTKLDRPIGAYLRENVYYAISGFNFIPAFLDLCFRSERTGSCSQPIILMDRWSRPALSWTNSP